LVIKSFSSDIHDAAMGIALQDPTNLFPPDPGLHSPRTFQPDGRPSPCQLTPAYIISRILILMPKKINQPDIRTRIIGSA